MHGDSKDENPKKEKVLHARVPEELDTEIKERARRLGISVSNLVRNVLTNSFGLVGDIVADSSDIARAAHGVVPHPITSMQTNAPARNRIIGWQEVTLSLNAVCCRCNAILPKGNLAGVAVRETPSPRQIACLSCIKEMTHAES